MVSTTNENDNRQQVLKLIEEKEKIEKKISELGDVLRKNNNIGFTEPLVDAEGFPRNDIDVRSVRLARNQIICLQNDLKKLMVTIDSGLVRYFEDVKDAPAATSSSKLPPESQMIELSIQENKETPFLVVTLVDENSPASTSGIQVNDRILKFGPFDHATFTDLAAIGELVKNSQNKQINVKVRRNNTQEVELTITPAAWNGQGLLGCKINAIPQH